MSERSGALSPAQALPKPRLVETGGGEYAVHGTICRMHPDWRQLAAWQGGLVSRRQLNAAGVDRFQVRNQVQAGRWTTVGPMVVATFTGELTWEQRGWAAHLHAGPRSLLGGLTSARLQGLRGWDRELVEVLIPHGTEVARMDGVTFVRSRRPLAAIAGRGINSHLAQLAPALLLRASSGMSERAAGGLLASSVQQRLLTADHLLAWLPRLQPLPRARLLRSLLLDVRGGAESMAEIDLGRICRRAGLAAPDRQRRRKDRGGRWRWTDAEWDLPNGRTLVLEVDGAFHAEVEHWGADLKRQRKITSPTRIVVRATALELRLEPADVVQDLRALGVPDRSGG